MLSHCLKQWWSTWWKAGPAHGSSGVCNVPEWSEGVKPGSTPSQTSLKGWQWRWGYFIWRSLHTWGIYIPHLLQPGILLLCCHCFTFHCGTVGEPGRCDSTCLAWIIFKRQCIGSSLGPLILPKEEIPQEAPGFLDSPWLSVARIFEEWGPIWSHY